ncbi:MAG: methyltransferase domain-containing protein [Candidatus Paceibacterota bacterium]|jgi:ADP-heptose:LPS heptosyltransferase/predicted SAM-dependent methyltransferase
MVWRIDDPQGDEAAKIKYLAVPYTRGIGADIGCGPRKAFQHFIGVDNCKDTELFGIPIEPDIRADVDKELPFDDGELDFVFSSHTLEHIDDHKAALAEWWRVIKPGGHLCLYLPHADFYPRVGEPGANHDHKHDFLPEDIVAAMTEVGNGWQLLENEARDEGLEYSFWQVYRKTEDGRHVMAYAAPKPRRTACVVRYGGFGDQLQAANILPALKRQGYHVTFLTTPKGQDVLAHDPHVDAWLLQDTDQVPNGELWAFWRAWEARFDKWVNLSESVEGTLLAMPGRANHAWPDDMRRRRLNVNYLEFTAELAGVPYRSEARFYTSESERAWADDFLREHDIGPEHFLVVVALSGSSLHKAYPWLDNVLAKLLLTMPDARFVMVGDVACKVLEQGWELEPRVVRTSGELAIRETLTLASLAGCVVGPETGVLNAVAFDPVVGKVCLLSHSSVENLTKHWRNAIAITPPAEVGCYPCHRLHYGADFCNVEPESGAALCQYAIDPARVTDAIVRIAKRRGGHEGRHAA